MKRLALLAALVLLGSAAGSAATEKSYVVVFNSGRLIWATDAWLYGGNVGYRSEATALRYGLPEASVWKILELHPAARRYLDRHAEIGRTVFFGRAEDLAAVDWDGVPPARLVWINPDVNREPTPLAPSPTPTAVSPAPAAAPIETPAPLPTASPAGTATPAPVPTVCP